MSTGTTPPPESTRVIWAAKKASNWSPGSSCSGSPLVSQTHNRAVISHARLQLFPYDERSPMDDSNAPATKGDLLQLRSEMNQQYDQLREIAFCSGCV